jgi:hypothetical protein
MKDPVKHCDVYKEDGCSHVDGYLCDFEKCDIRLEWAQKKNFETLEPAPENKNLEKRV